MLKHYRIYFLQRRDGGEWVTLDRAEAISDADTALAAALAAGGGGEVRLVGGDYDADTGAWSYRQLFYIDLSGVEPPSPGAAVTPEPEPAAAEPPQPAPELRAPAAATVQPPPPRRRGGFGAALLFLLVLVVMVAAIGIGAMVWLQHPLLFETADRLGVGHWVRTLETAMPSAGSASPGTPTAPPASSRAEPPLAGPVTRYGGVAPQLHGRWSSSDCETSAIAFEADGFVRLRAATGPGVKHIVTETLVDGRQYHLRLAPDRIEHYWKLDNDRIRYAGVTTDEGTDASVGATAALARCPSPR